ncbi:hypothetical protein BKA70DRAFT_1339483 [Coprinopsis sp. MPI-PUGE-AT-0042]|nr:hypothetical protein BKA70DRAFT_1339483 [Coprinopsis sp. MPI-PUGE-AT-0042]
MSSLSCPVPIGKSKTCAEAVRLKRLEYILQFASIAVLYYDYMLTLKDEITYIWMRKWKLSTLFYFCCRYALLANLLYLLAISEDLTGLKNSCHTGYKVCGALSVVGHIGVMAVWTLRTCAVYNNNKWLFAFFGILGSSVAIMLIYRTPFMRCSGQKDLSKLLGANGAIFLFIELFSFLLATWKVWQLTKDAKNKTDRPITRLNKLIMGVSILSVAVLILNFKWKTGYLSRLLNGLKLPLSGFLTARFMLRLRAWDKAGVHVSGKSHPTTGVSDTVHTMQFHERNSFFDEWKGDIGPARDAPSESDLSTKAESSSGRVHEILKPTGSHTSDPIEMDDGKSWGTRHGSEGRV